MEIAEILEFDKAESYLRSRNLVKAYTKAKKNLLVGNTKQVGFKLRRPKNEEIYQFRITKKYRAFGYFSGKKFIVFKISDHQ